MDKIEEALTKGSSAKDVTESKITKQEGKCPGKMVKKTLASFTLKMADNV